MKVETELQRDRHQIQTQLEVYIEQFEAAGDLTTSRKAREVLDKWNQNIIHIGICGHFSAGKSTFINRLLGKDLLPSSPIPTTAQVVTIEEGQPRANVLLSNGETLTLPVEQVEEWKKYCRQGEQVQRVTLYDDHPLLSGGIQILDTPGIDSTDSSHQQATQAAMHKADVIIFITDYNHVQSEVNFNFMKALKEKGKSLFLIINQIDKHRQQELSLNSFHERIMDGLSSWGIQIDGLLFTSLKEPKHPYNQWDQLQPLLNQIRVYKEELIKAHLQQSIIGLIGEHASFLSQQQEQQRNTLEEKIRLSKEEAQWEEEPNLLEQFERSQQAAQQWEEEIMTEVKKIVEQAIIFPYTTTQLAQQLIESCQAEFKVGFLFPAKKTQQERERRKQELYLDLSEKVQAQIEWHVKEALRKKAEQVKLLDQRLQSRLLDWTLSIPEEWLLAQVKRGTVSREYVYTYTKELSQRIHQLYIEHIQELILLGKEQLQLQHQERYALLQARLEKYRQIKADELQLERWQEEIDQQRLQDELIWRQLFQRESDFSYAWGIKELEREEQPVQAHGRSASTPPKRKNTPALSRLHGLERMAGQMSKAADLLQALPSMGGLVRDLLSKAERMKNRRFTICLFGAFSAGKSSFANALLGENILPVSPNPTTAAINQVLPATESFPSGTAVVQMKDLEQVEQEIRISLERLQLSTEGELAQLLNQVQQVEPHRLRTTLKPYYSFLSACCKGWSEAEAMLGEAFRADEQVFAQYVAVEEKACFVQSIQLYHDAPLTEQGIDIIDTPGADSIYARHTNVTFNYIKHADVIIYVTYYNHAFSQADRLFLDQMGRVKDQFALDKMFFIINAADLAQSTEELEGVVSHVEQNLLQSGIRFPRIYPLSSLQALEGLPDSGMEPFEQDFYQFLEQDLTQLLLQSAEQEVQRGQQLLVEMRAEMDASAEEKEAKLKEWEQKQEKWKQWIDEERYPSYMTELANEHKEQFYYIKQRLTFNFRSLVNEAFHPSVLSGLSGREAKQQLQSCLEELFFSVLYRLQEEMKAMSLRLEHLVYAFLDRAIVGWQERMQEDQIRPSGSGIGREGFPLPPIPDRLPTQEQKDWSFVASYFKQAKHFFEQGGRDQLLDELQSRLSPVIDRYLEQAENSFLDFYGQHWSKIEAEMKSSLIEETKQAIEAKQSALTGELSIQALEELIHRYSRIFGPDQEIE